MLLFFMIIIIIQKQKWLDLKINYNFPVSWSDEWTPLMSDRDSQLSIYAVLCILNILLMLKLDNTDLFSAEGISKTDRAWNVCMHKDCVPSKKPFWGHYKSTFMLYVSLIIEMKCFLLQLLLQYLKHLGCKSKPKTLLGK